MIEAKFPKLLEKYTIRRSIIRRYATRKEKEESILKKRKSRSRKIRFRFRKARRKMGFLRFLERIKHQKERKKTIKHWKRRKRRRWKSYAQRKLKVLLLHRHLHTNKLVPKIERKKHFIWHNRNSEFNSRKYLIKKKRKKGKKKIEVFFLRKYKRLAKINKKKNFSQINKFKKDKIKLNKDEVNRRKNYVNHYWWNYKNVIKNLKKRRNEVFSYLKWRLNWRINTWKNICKYKWKYKWKYKSKNKWKNKWKGKWKNKWKSKNKRIYRTKIFRYKGRERGREKKRKRKKKRKQYNYSIKVFRKLFKRGFKKSFKKYLLLNFLKESYKKKKKKQKKQIKKNRVYLRRVKRFPKIRIDEETGRAYYNDFNKSEKLGEMYIEEIKKKLRKKNERNEKQIKKLTGVILKNKLGKKIIIKNNLFIKEKTLLFRKISKDRKDRSIKVVKRNIGIKKELSKKNIGIKKKVKLSQKLGKGGLKKKKRIKVRPTVKKLVRMKKNYNVLYLKKRLIENYRNLKKKKWLLFGKNESILEKYKRLKITDGKWFLKKNKKRKKISKKLVKKYKYYKGVRKYILKNTKKTWKKLRKTRTRKININLFSITYQMLLGYHSPLGRRDGEWKENAMMTKIVMIRNRMSILDITIIFYHLRRMTNKIFYGRKLRKPMMLLTGRRYNWSNVFSFVFEEWLPGFLTNYKINIKDGLGHYFCLKGMRRRQKSRMRKLKMMPTDKQFTKKIRLENKEWETKETKIKRIQKIIKYRIRITMRKMRMIRNYFEDLKRKLFATKLSKEKKERLEKQIKKKLLKNLKLLKEKEIKMLKIKHNKGKSRGLKKAGSLVSVLKMPTVALSLIDDEYWHRECLKKGVSTIQVIDSGSKIEKIDYPIISNQSSLPVLSFLTMLSKEIAYQARYSELKTLRPKGGFNSIILRTGELGEKSTFGFELKKKCKKITERYRREVAREKRRERGLGIRRGTLMRKVVLALGEKEKCLIRILRSEKVNKKEQMVLNYEKLFENKKGKKKTLFKKKKIRLKKKKIRNEKK